MKETSGSFVKFLCSSKREILLITITVVITLLTGFVFSLWLSKVANLNVPSFGTIKTIGVEAYWDRKLENKTEMIDWGTVWPATSKNVTLYIRSINNIETTLYLNTTNWSPTNISEYMNLSWNYNGTTIHPGGIIEVTLTLSASSSNSFLLYLIANDVKQFSFDIKIGTSKYGD